MSDRHLPPEWLERSLLPDTGSCREGRRVFADLIGYPVPDRPWRPGDYPRLGQLV